jgi:hypothetical protein
MYHSIESVICEPSEVWIGYLDAVVGRNTSPGSREKILTRLYIWPTFMLYPSWIIIHKGSLGQISEERSNR